MQSITLGYVQDWESGSAPSVALHGDRVVAARVYDDGDAPTVKHHAGTVGPGGVDWNDAGGSFGQGVSPAVATNGDVAVAVYQAQKAATLYARVGTYDDGSYDWSDRASVGDGVAPDVALTGDGTALLVHGSASGSALRYRVGTVENGSVNWGSATEYDSGATPSVAVGDDGTVVEVHESQWGTLRNHGLWYHAGTLQDGQLTLGESAKYGNGVAPTVAVSGGGVVEAHASPDDHLSYREGSPNGQQVDWRKGVEYDCGRCPSVAAQGGQLVEVHEWGGPAGGLRYVRGGWREYATWMGDLDGLADRQLYQVTLPGTHDAGAYRLSNRMVETVPIPDWLPTYVARNLAETQRSEVGQQLADGIRWFDFRVAHRDGEFRFQHMFLGKTYDEILGEVADFLGQEHVTDELVVLKFSHFNARDQFPHAKFLKLIKDKLGGYVYRRSEGATLPTVRIGDAVQDGPGVIVVYDDDQFVEGKVTLWPWSGNIYSDFANTPKYATLRDDQQQKLDDNQGSQDRLFELQWVLTANASFFPNHFYMNLEQLSQRANPHLGEFLRSNRDKTINLIRCDYYQDAGVVDLAIERNRG